MTSFGERHGRRADAPQLYIRKRVSADAFIDAAYTYARETERSVRTLVYDDFGEFLANQDAEESAPVYRAEPLRSFLEHDWDPADETVTLRFLADEEYELAGALPPHTAFTYDDGKLEVAVSDDPVHELDDVLAYL